MRGASARRLRQEFPALERRFWRGHLWSPSYFAGSVAGAPIAVLRQYVGSQQRPETSPRPPIPPGVHAAVARWPTPFRPAGYDFEAPIAVASY